MMLIGAILVVLIVFYLVGLSLLRAEIARHRRDMRDDE